MKVRVCHQGYGCDTGCCGHVVELEDGSTSFAFAHPYGSDHKAFARSLAEEVIRREWPGCVASIDWDSLEVDCEDVSDC